MAKEREGLTLDDFSAEFTDTAYSPKAIEMAFSDMVELTGFAVRRLDEIELLGVLPEDMERTLELSCKALGVTNVWESQYKSHFPLVTVDDYVKFLSAIVSDAA